MARKNKSFMTKIRHNCSSCQATYTLLETHLTRKDISNCPINCRKTWEQIITKYCQEKVLSSELEQENSKDHGNN